jgi:hypothetical protein
LLSFACGRLDVVEIPPPTTFPGFDIGVYPGDDALRSWAYPVSPYRWVGYYLPAPCHRDVSFSGKRALIETIGWGTAAIYVGQQDWANIPSIAPLGARFTKVATESAATCSASLLTRAQGQAEAADAIAKMKADNFVAGSTIFLDVEHVSKITDSLIAYYSGWMEGIAADGLYKPGVYASKTNAPRFHELILRAKPTFWIAGSGGLTTKSFPADVGLSYASVWQGVFEVNQTYGGVTLNIDVDVASKISPSSP